MIATLSGMVAPSTLIPKATAVTAPPAGICTFAFKVTLYRANRLEVRPFRLTIPVARGVTNPLLHGIETALKGMVLFNETNESVAVI
jgi:hypothetical protein